MRPCGTLSLLSAALGLLSCGPVGLRVSPRAGTLSALVAPPSLVVSSVFQLSISLGNTIFFAIFWLLLYFSDCLTAERPASSIGTVSLGLYLLNQGEQTLLSNQSIYFREEIKK